MLTVMVVDDSKLMRKNIVSQLNKAGYNVVGEAEDGRKACAMYKELVPELVLMDITMPEMDGIEAVGNITSYDPDAKVIMVSALSQKKGIVDAMRNGAKHYILKPFSLITMQRVIADVMGRDDLLEDAQQDYKVVESETTDKEFVRKCVASHFKVTTISNIHATPQKNTYILDYIGLYNLTHDQKEIEEMVINVEMVDS